MDDNIHFDNFLSHSAKDTAVVRPLAEPLRQNGPNVWFDGWVVKSGDSIQPEIEAYPSHCEFPVSHFDFAQPGVSARPFGPSCSQLEAGRRRRRNLCFPVSLNRDRRFIFLRLDGARRKDDRRFVLAYPPSHLRSCDQQEGDNECKVSG